MASLRISKFSVRPESAVVLRYGTAVVLVAAGPGAPLILRYDNLPHPFTSFAFAAIALTFWCAGAGPGLLALILSSLALSALFVPLKILGPSSESYLVIYGIFGAAVSWFSASRRRAERLLREERESLEVRVGERTRELRTTNEQLQSTQAELRGEKNRLKLLLDLNNSIVSKLELRELLRVISASVRRVMQCDAVGVSLPDPETGKLKLYALDFPEAKGFLREGMVRPPDSLPGRVFRTAQPSTFVFQKGDTANANA